MLQCNISHSRDYRYPYTANMRGFAQTLPILRLLGRDEAFCKALIQAALGPAHNVIWQCQRIGRTVRFLYVEGIGRQAGLLESFMSSLRVSSGSPISCGNPGWWWMASLPSQGLENSGLSWKRRSCWWCFHGKMCFVSFVFLSPHQSWNNAWYCWAACFLCLQWKDKYYAVSSLNSRLVILRAVPLFSWTATGGFQGNDSTLK